MSASIDDQLGLARTSAAQGALAVAEPLYQSVLARQPNDCESLEFLAIHALRTGRAQYALHYFERRVTIAPVDLQFMENMGIAYERTGKFEQARALLTSVLHNRPDFFVSGLFLGRAHRASGAAREAQQCMRAAIQQAQRQGQWLNDASTPSWLLGDVRDAVAFINAELCRTLEEPLQPFVRTHGSQAVERITRFARSHSGVAREFSSDPRQKPNVHFIPGLPPSPWFDRTLLPWARQLELATADITAELMALMENGDRFEPFLSLGSETKIDNYLASNNGKDAAWNAFFFYRHGRRYDANCERCPKTAAVLDALPLIRLTDATPEVCFSVLTPGTRILPHRGDSNARMVVHLPLIVPQGCALSVAGEQRSWEQGRVLAFDDTYEHEAWNSSDEIRIVLIIDSWNPHLTEVEQAAFTEVFTALQLEGQLRS